MTYTIYTDGGARGNPGPAGIGFVIKLGHQLLIEAGDYIGETTNNVAEYQAVISALDWLQINSKGEGSINFFLDSNLVVNQLKGNFKIKQSHLQELANQVHQKLNQLKTTATFQYIPRAQNSRADFLVNQALDSR